MQEYIKEFVEGDSAYVEENYSETIDHLEKSLNLFWDSLKDCRLGCEKPFDMGWFPDFVSAIASKFLDNFMYKIQIIMAYYLFIFRQSIL